MHVSLPKTMAGIRIIPMMPRVRDAFIEEREAQKKTGKYNFNRITKSLQAPVGNSRCSCYENNVLNILLQS